MDFPVGSRWTLDAGDYGQPEVTVFANLDHNRSRIQLDSGSMLIVTNELLSRFTGSPQTTRSQHNLLQKQTTNV